ncbi:hypothetical protein QBC35DRAFT_551950 [Podospora australis]|uniref:FHA domain-containing protein n=1 Tax=Podospora australis TaxID=1536484 RepID=A0AAN7AHI8_9PEZI|nr:hypothetical protein QBC35DRAFT_551950 [Podospora australis]
MWLLESDLFEGKKLWLRPGKRYLFGRTSSEPGQLIVSDKTISRKHITIELERVTDGGGRNLHSRSQVTVTDLDSKKGTTLNGEQIRGQKKILSKDENEVKLGMCSKVLRIRWQPVVLSFSFTSKELRADPWARLRDDLEQLDIKYSAEFEPSTTHVVSKKRNTSKGLQALIHGRYIVTDSFISALGDAATVPDGAEEGTVSALEEDFDGAWPNPLDHLPPRGEEATDRPITAYAPDERRQEVFDGYTFVFYEKKQFDNLQSAITAGKGKALLKEVTPGQTDIDDFIRYVKGVAGEKGLGSFEDGSEGRGVVVVRYMPKDDTYEWFAQFLTSFAQRLDHRPIDQREFIEAILECNASMLRRPLEAASQSDPSGTMQALANPGEQMEVDRPGENQMGAPFEPPAEKQPSPEPAPARARGRRGVSRFKGFDFDEPELESFGSPSAEPSNPPEPTQPSAPSALQDDLFVSQRQSNNEVPEEEARESRTTRRATRKRPLSPLPEIDNNAFMDEIAPTTGHKRRRVQPPPPEPEAPPDEEMVVDSPPDKKKGGRTVKGRASKKTLDGEDILELARQRREQAEAAAAAAERQALADLNEDDIDYEAIRNMQIGEIEVRFPASRGANNARSRDQDIAEGRWDPRWNGRKNFKQFRKQGVPAGRRAAAPRVVIALEEVKPNQYGIGDDYWLEDTESSRAKNKSQSQHHTAESQPPPATSSEKQKGPARRAAIVLDSSGEDDDQNDDEGIDSIKDAVPEPAATHEPSRSRAAKAAERASARRSEMLQQESQSQAPSLATRGANKRTTAAAELPSSSSRAAKKPRRGFLADDNDDSGGDSEDELKFRFGRRK